MSEFLTYLQLGFSHITDLEGFDHILFIAALCLIYQAKDWKKIAWLVTAFTIGHSITLALSTLDLIHFDKNIVETMIPITIILTCFLNLKADFKSNVSLKKKLPDLRYPTAIVFGLIHGMGFSSYLKSLLGKDQSIFSQLLAFNIGLEIGQLIIVIVVMSLSFLLLDIFKCKPLTWVLVGSGFVAGMAFKLLLERI
jgi:hydrogenase/urease accessory protein HupE